MKFDNLIATIKAIGKDLQVWLTNETFNEFAKAKFRLNRKGNLIIYTDSIEIEISIEEKLSSNCVTSFARIERISEVFPNTQLLKGDIYISPNESQKSSLIL